MVVKDEIQREVGSRYRVSIVCNDCRMRVGLYETLPLPVADTEAHDRWHEENPDGY